MCVRHCTVETDLYNINKVCPFFSVTLVSRSLYLSVLHTYLGYLLVNSMCILVFGTYFTITDIIPQMSSS